MNVLFVYSLTYYNLLNTPEGGRWIQFGISSISSFLKKHGHHTKLIVLSRFLGKKNKEIIDKYLQEFQPKLICFTAVATEYPFIADMAKYIKGHYPNIYLLVGGPHVSLNPREILSDDFDALCIGEGENPTLELVLQLEKGILPSDIPNLWIKHRSEINKNLPRPFLQDIDSLSFPDRKIWQEWMGSQVILHVVLLGRGCPFQCAYCCNHALKKLASGNYVRLRSPDNIIEEIKEIAYRSVKQNEIFLEVESITLNEKWTIELCSKLEQLNASLSQPLSFATNLRVTPNTDFENLFVAFKKSNFKYLNIGFESGSERVRREILNRNYSNQDVIDAVRLARRHGLKIAFFNLVGIPGETMLDFKETVKINRICQPDWYFTSIFFPYPGTDLYALCKKEGLLKDGLDVEMERRKATLDLPGFSKKQIQKSYVWFDYYIYKGYRPLHKILANVIETKLQTKSSFFYFYKSAYFSFFRSLMKKILRTILKII